MGLLSPRQDDPAAVMRPFDAGRDGQVWGEGAAVFALESRRGAEARGATILGQVLSWASACHCRRGVGSDPAAALRRTMQLALERAGVTGQPLGHVNAQGLSTVRDDPVEAEAIRAAAPNIPVTAPRSFFGNLGAAGGAVEAAASVLSFRAGLTPPTLNYERPAADCRLPIVHGAPAAASGGPALLVNWTIAGQAVGVVLAGPE